MHRNILMYHCSPAKIVSFFNTEQFTQHKIRKIMRVIFSKFNYNLWGEKREKERNKCKLPEFSKKRICNDSTKHRCKVGQHCESMENHGG